MDKKNRNYRTYDPSKGYPVGSNLFYECMMCSEIVPSTPTDSTYCSCRNIMIDVDYGRISIQDHSKARLFEIARDG